MTLRLCSQGQRRGLQLFAFRFFGIDTMKKNERYLDVRGCALNSGVCYSALRAETIPWRVRLRCCARRRPSLRCQVQRRKHFIRFCLEKPYIVLQERSFRFLADVGERKSVDLSR
ncbi:hypothetical protein PHSY_007407 [Pseudozyma hubeiensis SY62]|uniref:Uncharacterized protein n=1 Tax=Pseudozyma hubeiensis (strain SY62) TaxID=1305764 RepID=R9PEM2_PSEHS|nr:hypothetical protein PHSY_007407 [Pseudozyma hubeiensis SY62]GAC99804.1 hypothetical protein PHSY_007407 [Pseudozyma hubeiensis SY62]